MPLYSKQGLQIDGLRPVLASGLCVDGGQEDFANSLLSGRWLGGLVTFRKKLWTDDTSFAPNTQNNEQIIQLPSSPSWGFYPFEAIVQAKTDVGSSPGGSVGFSLGTDEVPGWDNIFAGPSTTPAWPPEVFTWRASGPFYGSAPGIGGQPLTRTYREIRLKMDNAGFLTLNNSPIVVVVMGYLIPDATNASA